MCGNNLKWAVLAGTAAVVVTLGTFHGDAGALPDAARSAIDRVIGGSPAQRSPSQTGRELLAGFTWGRQDANSNGSTAIAAIERPAALRGNVSGRPADRSAPVAQAIDDARVSPRLAAMAQGAGQRPIEVVLQYHEQPGAAERAQVEALGGQVLRTYENFPFMAALLPANKIGDVAQSANTRFMDFNARIHSASAAARQTAYVPNSGSGTNYPVSSTVGVAVVDSGVAIHPDLNVIERVVFNDSRTSFFGNLYDKFDKFDYYESDGSEPWNSTPWTEINDDGAVTTGKIRIQTGNCPYADWETCLELSGNSTTSTAIERKVGLLGAKSATLTFEYQVKNITSSAAFVLEASNNGGLTWTTLQTFATATAYSNASVNLTPYLGLLTKIRFRVTDTDPTATLTIDWVDVKFRTSSYYRDEFASTEYTNSVGTETWPNAWTESGESTSASAGKIRIETHANCPISNNSCLSVDANKASGYTIQRSVNLANTFGAVLSFDYRLTTSSNSARFQVEASKDAGATWSVLDSIDLSRGTYSYYDQRYDLTPYMAADTRIRFRVASAASSTVLRIDNIEINVDRGNTNDALGHGTHIAGIIGGNGGSSGQQPGVARGARIHQVRVLDGRGRGTVADLVAGLDWIYSNGAAKGIKVVNLSLGTGVSVAAANDPLVIAAERLWDAGFVVVASAGNYGIFGNMTITSPGTARKIITVGSLTDWGTGTNFSDDFVSTFSSRGPTMLDHVLKPDLIAPGNLYVSTVAADSRLKAALPLLNYSCGTGCTSSYMMLSGTSMAAAQVSGAVLLMLSKEPALSPSTVKARLMRSARKISGSDPTATGAGVLHVTAALNDTGYVTAQALSPLMQRSAEGSAIMVQDTALLWGNPMWGAGYLWQNGYLWSNNFSQANGYLWSDGYLWQNGYLWSNGYLWNNGYLWQNGYLWSDGYLWEDATYGLGGQAGANLYNSSIMPD
jgi:hypothetical protein